MLSFILIPLAACLASGPAGAVIAGLPGSPWGYRTVTKVKTVSTACAGCTCPECCANRANDTEAEVAEQLFVPQPIRPIVVNPPRPPQAPKPAYEAEAMTTEQVAFKKGPKKIRTRSSRRTCGPGGCG